MSFLNENENELVMESMVSQEVEPTQSVDESNQRSDSTKSVDESNQKKVSKSLTMNEKRSMYGILSFLVIANRDGILDDAKTQELMEYLPIFKTISEKKEFLSQEMFDMKMIEKDILKPMVSEHNAKKKQEKKEEKKKAKKEKDAEGVLPKEVKKKEPKKKAPKKEKVVEEDHDVPKEEVKKETKKRAPKKEKVVEEDQEVPKEEVKKETKKRAPKKEKVVESESEVPEKDQKKRGRKAKQQIVECNTEVNVNAGNSQEDQLADLVNQLTGSGSGSGSGSVLELQHPEEIDLADLDDVLSNLEEGEKEEQNRVMTPRLPEVEVEKKGKESKKKVVTKPKTSKK